MAFISKYGVARHVFIPIVKRAVVDFAVGADWTPAAGDVKISKDGGAAANVTNLPVAIVMGNGAIWDFSLTATEMQAAQIVVTVVDAATKAVEDQSFIIETHGNASAQFQVDLADVVRAGMTALPNAAAEAAGGLFTRGAGAGQLNQQANGQLDANVARWLNTAVATPLTAGVPLVDTRQCVRVNTAAAGSASTITLDAGASALDNFYYDMLIVILSGAGVGQARLMGTYAGATKIGAVVPNWTTSPDNTSVFAIIAAGAAELRLWNGSSPNGLIAGRVDSNPGAMQANVLTAAAIATDAITAAKIAADAIGASELAADAVTEIQTAVAAGAVASVIGNVGGNVVGSVGSVVAAVTTTFQIKKNTAGRI